MLSGGKDIIAAYRHSSNERNCAHLNNIRRTISTPKRTPTANIYIKTYEPAMLTDVASSLSQGPSRNATKKLRSLEQRATPQLQEKYSYSQHTRSICYQVPIIIVTVCHRMARPSNCALSNDERHAATPSNCALSYDKWHAATLTSPMTLLIQLYNPSFHHLPYSRCPDLPACSGKTKNNR